MIRAYTKRADDLFGRLLQLYRANSDPYSRPTSILPEDASLLPVNLTPGCVTEANYWLCLCYYMRGQVKSVEASKALKRLHESHPELFVFEYVAGLEPEELRTILMANKVPWMSKRIAEFWVYNARDLVDAGISDITRLYEGEINRKIIYGRICRRGNSGLRSFQEKMADMLTYYLEVHGLVEPFEHSTPVDFQAMRLVLQHEVLVHYPDPSDGNYGSPEALARTRELTESYCRRYRVEVHELAAAIWLFGSEMCSQNPVAWMHETTDYAARSTGLAYVDLWAPMHVRAYDSSCRVCPIADTCKWAVGAKPYYVHGRIVRERERDDYPPPPTLFNPD